MPRPSRPWFRFYVEAFADRKLRRLRPEYRWLYMACLGAARQSPEPGVLLVSEGVPMDDRDIADFAGMDLRSVRAGLRHLIAAGLIVTTSLPHREGIVPLIAYTSPTFQKRQFESDDVTKRTRKHRATRADAPEGTFQRRSEERDSASGGNAPDTETETETEEEPPLPPTAELSLALVTEPPRRPVDRFDEWWQVYPRKAEKVAARKAWARVTRTIDAEVLIDAALRYAADPNREEQFTKLPTTWLNKGSWDDGPLPAKGRTNGTASVLNGFLDRHRAPALTIGENA